MRILLRRVWYILRRRRFDADLDEELNFHREMTRQRLEADGMATEAAIATRRALGSTIAVREQVRDVWIGRWLQEAVQDVRYAGRQVWRSPQLAAAVVATLVIGIGLNSAAFSAFNGILFRAQVTRDPASFVQTYSFVTGDRDRQWHGTPTKGTLELYDALRTHAQSMSAVTAGKWETFRIRDAEFSTMVRGKFVSCNYVSAYMGPMIIGRGFVDNDCAATGDQPVAVLSEIGWTTRFNRDPTIVGRTLHLDNQFVTVIGVSADGAPGEPQMPHVLVPYTQASREYFRDPPSRHAWLDLSGRLARGKSREQANAELNVIAAALDREHPGRSTKILVTDGALYAEPRNAQGMNPLIVLVLGTMLLLLLMVCSNVTTLLLARAAARRHEMALRASLGATRSRLLRQLLTESLALSIGAGVLSLGLAYYLPRPIAQMLAGNNNSVTASFALDWRVLGYTWGLAMVAGCAAGLTPAFESLRTRLAGGANPLARGGGQTTTFLRGTLIAEQLAISLALLVAMGLVLRSGDHILKPEVGYDPNATLVANIDLASLGYSHYSALAFYDRLLPRLQSLPGVGTVAVTSLPPFQGQRLTEIMTDVNGRSSISTQMRAASPTYFDMTGIRLVRGRLFSTAESRFPRNPAAVVLSESLARAISLDAHEIGQRLSLANGSAVQIIGVVSDTSSVRPGERDDGMLYQAMGATNLAIASVMLKFTGNAQSLMSAVRTELRALDPRLFVSPETVATTIARESQRYGVVVKLVAIPASVVVFLSVIGIYGVTAFAVAQRRHEIGVRSALGARPRQIVSLFFLSLRWPLVAGLFLGILLSAVGNRLLQRANLVTDVSLADPWAYGSALILLMCAAGATLIPALRGAYTDPWCVLRED
jgi:predicted permease